MTTETAPTPHTTVAEDVPETGAKPRFAASALINHLRDYGLVLALIAIMLFIQYTTEIGRASCGERV